MIFHTLIVKLRSFRTIVFLFNCEANLSSERACDGKPGELKQGDPLAIFCQSMENFSRKKTTGWLNH